MVDNKTEEKETKEKKVDSDIIPNIIQFWKKIYEEEGGVVIKFIKKDGTTRIMHSTLNFKKIPVKDHPKEVNIQKILDLMKQNKIVHVYDVDKKAWRSVPYDKVEYLDTKSKRYYTKKR